MNFCCDEYSKRCYVEDEGRPLEAGLQEQVSNQCMRLQLRAGVVSDT